MTNEISDGFQKNSARMVLGHIQEMKHERLKLGLELEQVAAKAGISLGLLRKLEAGEFAQFDNFQLVQNVMEAYSACLRAAQTDNSEELLTVNKQTIHQKYAETLSHHKRRRAMVLSLVFGGALLASIAAFFQLSLAPQNLPPGAIGGHLSLAREAGYGMGGQLADQLNKIRSQIAQQPHYDNMPSTEGTFAEGQADQTQQVAENADLTREHCDEEQEPDSIKTSAWCDYYSQPSAASAMEKEQRLLEAKENPRLQQQSFPLMPTVSNEKDEWGQSAAQRVADHWLELQATANCWVEVSIDNSKREKYLLRPGERRTYSVDKEARLMIGNAGGIRIKWDGQLLDPGGKPGRVLRLKLPGVQQRP